MATAARAGGAARTGPAQTAAGDPAARATGQADAGADPMPRRPPCRSPWRLARRAVAKAYSEGH
eukprot:44702-Prymnesium_polylepis.1